LGKKSQNEIAGEYLFHHSILITYFLTVFLFKEIFNFLSLEIFHDEASPSENENASLITPLYSPLNFREDAGGLGDQLRLFSVQWIDKFKKF
jgi:hypothetical protein